MIRVRWFTLAVLMLGLCAVVGAAAQGGGQLWVRLFLDSNANGQRDPGEPLLTRGAAVSLQDPSGVIIATGLLDDSPNGAQGLLGFQGLSPAAYTVVVTSADFAPTGEGRFTREVTGDGVPVVIEFGAQPIVDEMPELPAVRGLFGLPIYLGERVQVARVALGLLGACIVAAFMTLLGMVTYWLVARRARKALLVAGASPTLGSTPTVAG